MLKDSESPQTALLSLCDWLALEETKEVLNLLKDKADLAEVMVKASPQAYRDNKDGNILDGDVISQLRNQFIGEEKGLRHLSKLLAQREKELREKLKEQEQTQT